MIGYLWKLGKKTRLGFSTLGLTGSASRKLGLTGLAGVFCFICLSLCLKIFKLTRHVVSESQTNERELYFF